MAEITVAGIAHEWPEDGDKNWGQKVTRTVQAIATLANDVDKTSAKQGDDNTFTAQNTFREIPKVGAEGSEQNVATEAYVSDQGSPIRAEIADEATTRTNDDNDIRTIMGASGANQTERRETAYNASGLAGLNTGHVVTASNYSSAAAISAVRSALDVMSPVGRIMTMDPHALGFADQMAYWQFSGEALVTDRPSVNAMWFDIGTDKFGLPVNNYNTYVDKHGGALDREARADNHWGAYYGWFRDASGNAYASKDAVINGWYELKGGMWLACMGVAPLPLTFGSVYYTNFSGLHVFTHRLIHDLTAGRLPAGYMVGGVSREVAGAASQVLTQAQLPFHSHYDEHIHASGGLAVSSTGSHSHGITTEDGSAPGDTAVGRAATAREGNTHSASTGSAGGHTHDLTGTTDFPTGSTYKGYHSNGKAINYSTYYNSGFTDDQGRGDFNEAIDRAAVPIVPLQQQVQYFMRVQ